MRSNGLQPRFHPVLLLERQWEENHHRNCPGTVTAAKTLLHLPFGVCDLCLTSVIVFS
jgi:hypothetical protein